MNIPDNDAKPIIVFIVSARRSILPMASQSSPSKLHALQNSLARIITAGKNVITTIPICNGCQSNRLNDHNIRSLTLEELVLLVSVHVK